MKIEYNGFEIESDPKIGILTIMGWGTQVYSSLEEAEKSLPITDSSAFKKHTMDLHHDWYNSNVIDPVDYAKKVIDELDWFRG